MRRLPEMSVLDRHDALLLDLDGTLMHGARPIPGATDGVRVARAAGLGIAFATNNASRSPAQVVSHLATVDVEASEDEIVTSPQIAAQLLADRLDPGAAVLVIGGPSLAEQIAQVGLHPVSEDTPEVSAVIQGWAPDVDWAMLAEGAYALGHGAHWMATNVDATLPTEKGLAPGNGSLVAALRHATGLEPEIAGKPLPGMFEIAARRLGSRRPLVVGDRLDTDIEAGVRAHMDTLLVLTGVSTLQDALHADPVRRPALVLPDMSALDRPLAWPVVDGATARCGRFSANWEDGDVRVNGSLEEPEAARAALALVTEQCPDHAFTGTVHESTRPENA